MHGKITGGTMVFSRFDRAESILNYSSTLTREQSHHFSLLSATEAAVARWRG